MAVFCMVTLRLDGRPTLDQLDSNQSSFVPDAGFGRSMESVSIYAIAINGKKSRIKITGNLT